MQSARTNSGTKICQVVGLRRLPIYEITLVSRSCSKLLKDHPGSAGCSEKVHLCPALLMRWCQTHDQLSLHAGSFHEYGSAEYSKYIPEGTRHPGSRAVIIIDIHKVGTVHLLPISQNLPLLTSGLELRLRSPLL